MSIELEILKKTQARNVFKINKNAIQTSLNLSIISTSVNLLLSEINYSVLVDCTAGVITITLPAVNFSEKRIYNIKKIDSTANRVIIQANGAELIDDENTKELLSQWECGTIQCNGVKWYRI